MTWKHPLKTSRSSGRSLRPNVKPILIVQTPSPMPPLLALLTSIFRTRTDPHIFDVFRHAQITLRILIICESYPFLFVSLFLFYICAYSTYSLYSGLILVLTCFFVLSVLLFTLREAFKLQSVKREATLYLFIFVHIPYFIFLSQATFILGESSETILLFVDSGGSAVGHVSLDV